MVHHDTEGPRVETDPNAALLAKQPVTTETIASYGVPPVDQRPMSRRLRALFEQATSTATQIGDQPEILISE